jgi:hypothetical protein
VQRYPDPSCGALSKCRCDRRRRAGRRRCLQQRAAVAAPECRGSALFPACPGNQVVGGERPAGRPAQRAQADRRRSADAR